MENRFELPAKGLQMSDLQSLPRSVGHLPGPGLLVVLVADQHQRDVSHRPLDLIDQFQDRLELCETLFRGDAEYQYESMT